MTDDKAKEKIERLCALARQLKESDDIGGLQLLQKQLRAIKKKAQRDDAAQGEKRKESR